MQGVVRRAGPYDIFQVLRGGGLWWLGSYADINQVHLKLCEFGKSSCNEFQAKDAVTGQIVERVNEADLPPV
jgi:hypothetical protein